MYSLCTPHFFTYALKKIQIELSYTSIFYVVFEYLCLC
eukprot:SAG11_NODE_1887_length_4116_cov_8.004730_1_plen_38_part_00